jgi:hypothetical protein
MKRAFFLIILLHYGISNAAQPSAPSASWLTEADIMEVQSLGNIPAAKPSDEELAQLRWQAERYQESLRNTAAMQEGQKHRGAWTAPVPDPAVSACAAPAKPPRQKDLTHKRNRSNSEPAQGLPMSPPPFAHFTTEVTDASLLVALKALEDMEKNAAKLFQEAKEALQKGQERHKELLATEIDTQLPKRTGVKKALNLLQSERKRLEHHLDKQTKQHAQLQANSGQALNILISTVLNARTVLADLQEKVSVKSEKTAVKQEELRQRANSTSGSPRLSTGTKRT